jgi:hypothetical protein
MQQEAQDKRIMMISTTTPSPTPTDTHVHANRLIVPISPNSAGWKGRSFKKIQFAKLMINNH